LTLFVKSLLLSHWFIALIFHRCYIIPINLLLLLWHWPQPTEESSCPI